MKNGIRGFGASGLALVLAAGAIGTLGVTGEVSGQVRNKPKEELRPPIPPTDKEAKANYWGGLAVIVSLGTLCAVSLIPSKRGHQD